MISEKEIKNWYDQRHISFGENAWRPFEAYSIFLDHLNVKAGKILLDIGCGTGYLIKAATQRGLQTYGTDISEQGIKLLKESLLTPKLL
jgi:cyclopropane fatty-acyl-phospholipid synthase-like methyltransferase